MPTIMSAARPLLAVVCVVAATLFSGGCSSGKGVTSRIVMRGLTIVTTPMGPCQASQTHADGSPDDASIKKVVRVIIPGAFNPTVALTPDVRIKDHVRGDNEDNDDAKHNGTSVADNGGSPFDIVLSHALSGGEYAEIRLVLEGSAHAPAAYTFSTTDGVQGVGAGSNVGDTPNPFSFCGAHVVIPNHDGNQVAVFYVPAKAVTVTASEAAYNFQLLPSNISNLSILVDPKVKNSG